MLCTQVLNGLTSTIGVLKFNVGQDFDIVTVSFNPKETPDLAQAKKASYLARYKREGAGSGWHFLTGTQHSIESLTGRVGFRYAYNPSVDQYAHASGIMVLTPDGELSRYFFGIEYAPRDLQLALIEASDRRIGSLVDQLPLFCFHYDPAKRATRSPSCAWCVAPAWSRSSPSWPALSCCDAGSAGRWAEPEHDVFEISRRHSSIGRARFLTPMQPGFQLFPDQASTLAPRVDNLYFFLLAVFGVLRRARDGGRHRLRDQVPAPLGGRGRRSDPWIARPRTDLDRHPVHPRDGDVRVGRQRLLRHRASAGRNARHLRRREAVDVEVPAPRGAARNQHAARAGRTHRSG